MNFINKTPNPSGSYPPIFTASKFLTGCAIVPTQELHDVFYQYNGFVTPTYSADGLTVTDFTPNTEARDAWLASLPPTPEPTPTTEEVIAALIASLAEKGIVP